MRVMLKDARRSKGLTQKQLAKLLGVSQPILSQYETGQRVPNLIVSRKIAEALEVSLDELCFGVEKER